MDWYPLGALVLAIGGMFAWLRSDIALNRSEARADIRMLIMLMEGIRTDIAKDSREFHGRIVAIEEKNKSKEV